MNTSTPQNISRRQFLGSFGAEIAMVSAFPALSICEAIADTTTTDAPQALISITLDLEMSRHYPHWDMMEWDYMKGNLDEPTKQYALEVARRVKAKGGVIHCFLLGQTLEQPDINWLKELIKAGHSIGNHTYDHVNVWYSPNQNPKELQFRFQRCPWLVEGKTPQQVVRENIRLTELAMKYRLDITPVGFRTPGGSPEGLRGREDLQKLFLELGYRWVSSMAPMVPIKEENPTNQDFNAIVAALADSQPFSYPTGLVEIPMSPLGDVAAFRRKDKKWKIGDFLKMIERNIAWAIKTGGIFDLLTHPSIMMIEDPKFRTYDLICDLVNNSGGKAAIVNLDTIARRIHARQAIRSVNTK